MSRPNLKYQNYILKISLQEYCAIPDLQYAYYAVKCAKIQSNYRNAY